MLAAPALPTDAPVLTAFRDYRGAYEHVTICPDYEANSWPYYSTQVAYRQPLFCPLPTAGYPVAAESARDYLIGRMLRFARQAEASALSELSTKQLYYEGIDVAHVARAAFLMAGALGILQPNSVVTTLTYDQSLHARAELPFGYGSVQVSVLLTPGLDPLQQTGEREEEDNTLISVFNATGTLANSAEGPMLLVLKQLMALTARLPLPVVADTHG